MKRKIRQEEFNHYHIEPKQQKAIDTRHILIGPNLLKEVGGFFPEVLMNKKR